MGQLCVTVFAQVYYCVCGEQLLPFSWLMVFLDVCYTVWRRYFN